MERRSNPSSLFIVGMLLTCGATACNSTDAVSDEPARGEKSLNVIVAQAAEIKPLSHKLGKPRPGDWLASHKERGQTFQQYRKSDPNRPNSERTRLYIQTIGPFTKTQDKIVAATTDFLGRFYGLEVKSLPALELKAIPESARRIHPKWGDNQLLTSYILKEVLKPRRPRDAVAVLGLTASDLWPGEGWNFVFGEANLTERVGVWSLYRNGNPDESDEAYKLYLRRALKVSSHETGHMFGIQHCTQYECGMNGANNQEESDEQPLFFCAECAPKIWWACGLDAETQYKSLLEFCEQHKLEEEATFCEQSIALLKLKYQPKR